MRTAEEAAPEHWTARFSRPIIFTIIALVAVGVYLAYTIPGGCVPGDGLSAYRRGHR